jgi:hypothetical protein
LGFLGDRPIAVGGNDWPKAHYPSNYPNSNVISVAATNNQDALAGFSNYGATSVDLSTLGVNIYSTLPSNTYGAYVDGREMTSFTYDTAEDLLSYTSSRLSYGRHTVRIDVTDADGNTTTGNWNFRIRR